MAKFIFIPDNLSTLNRSQKVHVLRYYYNVGILNVLLFTKELKTINITAFSYNPFKKRNSFGLIRHVTFGTRINTVYPNKLKNLSGYSYNVTLFLNCHGLSKFLSNLLELMFFSLMLLLRNKEQSFIFHFN